jgi:hypothetical protein
MFQKDFLEMSYAQSKEVVVAAEHVTAITTVYTWVVGLV